MAELKAGEWPIVDTDIDAIDPHAEFIPRGPEADKEASAKDAKPWGLEDRSDNTNVSKNYDASDKFKTKDDEYMNKEPSNKMKNESRKGRNTMKTNLQEAFDKYALDSQSWDREEMTGEPGDTPYREYTFDAEGLQQLADELGVDVATLKAKALPTDGFDDSTLTSAGLPLGDPDNDYEGRYEEYVFDADDFNDYESMSIDDQIEDGATFGVEDGEDWELMEGTSPRILQAMREMSFGEEEVMDNIPADAEVPTPPTGSGDPAPDASDVEIDTDAIDTFEHALGGYDKMPMDPLKPHPISEGSYFDRKIRIQRESRRRNRMTEAASKGALIKEYIDQLATPSDADYDDFATWWDDQDTDAALPNKYYFNTLLKKNGIEISKPVRGKKEAEVEPPKDPVNAADLMDDPSDLGAFTSSDSVDLLRPETSVEERYDELFGQVKYWAKEPKKPGESSNDHRKISGNARHVLVYGNPGIGKTHTVLEAVRSALADGVDFETQYVRGSLGGGGKSKGMLYKFFETFGEGYLIVFDDADDLLDMKGGDANIIKALMEPNNPMTAVNSRGIIKSMQGTPAPAEAPIDMDESGLSNYLNNDLMARMTENFFDDDDDGDTMADDGGEDEVLADDEDPGDEAIILNMRSRMLFISNRRRDQIDDAIFDRVREAPLVLTSIEVVDRINQLLDVFLANETMFDQEKIAWAKKNAFKWLKLAVAAAGAPIKFPNGATLTFPNVDKEGANLTFRNYIALVYDWLKRADVYEGKNNVELMTVKTLPGQFLRGFLISTLLPMMRSVAGEK